MIRSVKNRLQIALCAAALAIVATPAVAGCKGAFAVEVLGSGGPLADDERASSAYLVWRNGQAMALIDAGGGAFLRLAESGANFETLDAILISHFHADHVSDLPAILKSGSFSKRTKTVTIAGPSGNAYFPGLGAFLRALFDKDAGAFRYLSQFLTGAGGAPALRQAEIAADGESLTSVFDGGGMRIEAIPVNHGDVPALAFRVAAEGKAVVFAGDQSVQSDAFDAALEASAPALLIAHHAISQAPGQPRGLHRAPSSIGEMAASLGAEQLVLSHNMKRALDQKREGLAAIRAVYKGKVTIANDHSCFVIAR